MSEKTMKIEWVIGRAIGDRAKSIMDHANAGIGYFIMESGKQGNQQTCLYAFRRAADAPVPDHLTVVVEYHRIQKLDDRYSARHDTHESKQAASNPASDATIKKIKEIFDFNRTHRDVTGSKIEVDV
jgi:hypothetical protein